MPHWIDALAGYLADEGASPEEAQRQSDAFDQRVRDRLAARGALEGIAEGESFKLMDDL